MKRKHLSYSDEIREQVIHEYVSGSTSTKLSKSWGIPQSTLRDWLKPYIIQRKALSLHSKNNKDKSEVMKKDFESENALLKARIKELEKKTKFLELQVLSRDMMIDIAEKNGIEIRKKIWGQVVTELVSLHKTNVSAGCRLFGHCRQAYYQFRSDFTALYAREKKIVECISEIRSEDPGIGGYKLWVMLKSLLGDEIVPGRDSFYRLLRRHCLMLPPPKARHTTNSNHRFHKWKNKIKGFVPTAPNQLWVSDITYISLEGGDVCYLHLVTDAYSHKIIGWALADSLRAVFTMDALLQAISQAVAMCGSDNLEGLIHHSDRGVQYCCDSYVSMLQKHNIAISMTEDYKPTDNAIAERVNGIIKVESVYRQRFTDIDHARSVIGKYIDFYNNRRPHMSIGLKVPSQAHKEVGEQKKTWNNKKKYKNVSNNAGKVLPLPSRTTCPGSASPAISDR